MANEKCPHCEGNLVEVGVMNSGNSKFQLFECEKCYKEVQKCIGVVANPTYS